MNTPLVMKAWPSMVSEAMPSGEEMVKVPPWVVLSFEVSEPADSPTPRLARRSSSLTVTSPPLAAGVRSVITGGELPIEMVSVVCEV
ncbi:hypothetical protein, partial [Mesorhizobium sp. M0592]|uniref:hypothetical protein n=1 Tax=Mesorhizobium sp. M0592 TaxID=2956967 RepID=UPI003338D003